MLDPAMAIFFVLGAGLALARPRYPANTFFLLLMPIALAGGIFFMVLKDSLSTYIPQWEWVLGILLLIIVFWWRQGLVGFVRVLITSFKHRIIGRQAAKLEHRATGVEGS